MENNINWLSILLAIFTPFLMGYIYYHKNVFGNVLETSISMTDNNASKTKRVIAFLISILFSFVLSFFLLNFNNDGLNQEGQFDSFQHGAWHGVILAIATAIPVIVINNFFQQKPWKHIVVNIFYWVITLAIMGGILDAMNHWENIPMPN